MVIWITGLSGAGKTTLCRALQALLKPHVSGLVILDGDEVRQAFGNEFGHSEPERERQFRRLQGIAHLLDQQGMIVVVTAVFNRPHLLQWNRENFSQYFEVVIDCSFEMVRNRDSKGLYAQAMNHDIKDVVGVDIRWTKPKHADLVINGDSPRPPDQLAKQVVNLLPENPHLARIKRELALA